MKITKKMLVRLGLSTTGVLTAGRPEGGRRHRGVRRQRGEQHVFAARQQQEC